MTATTEKVEGAVINVEVLQLLATPNDCGMFFLNVNQIVAIFDNKRDDGEDWTQVQMSDGKSRLFPGKAQAFVQKLREGLEVHQ